MKPAENKKTAYIVTGTTRGIGRSLATAILDAGHQLFSISRSDRQSTEDWLNVPCDLSRAEEVVDAMQQIMAPMAAATPDRLVLINNAGVLPPMGPMEKADPDHIVNHVLVNIGAPAVLTSQFIRLTQPLKLARTVINMSSGAAHKIYVGWSYYCAAKAALDMLTRCAAAEQDGRPDPVAICAIYPGKVDTDMQRLIRAADPAHFPLHAQFVRAKQKGELLSPERVARMVVAMDQAEQFRNGGLYELSSARFDADGRVIGVVDHGASG